MNRLDVEQSTEHTMVKISLSILMSKVSRKLQTFKKIVVRKKIGQMTPANYSTIVMKFIDFS